MIVIEGESVTDNDADRLKRVEQIAIDLKVQLTQLTEQIADIHRLTKESEPLLAMAKGLPIVKLLGRK